MIKKLTIGVAAIATFVMPSAANAADFIRITLNVSGYATRLREVLNPNGTGVIDYRLEGALNSVLEFYAPGTLASFSGDRFNGNYFREIISGYANATNFVAGQSTVAYTKGGYSTFSVNACGNFSNLTAGVTIAVNPLCSTIKFTRTESTGPNLAGDYASFDGVVTGFTFTQGSADVAPLGVINAPILPVPELATWAMMIVGVGVIGAMARRRVTTQARFA